MNYNPIFFITSAELNEGNIVLTPSGTPTIQDRNVATFVFARGVAVPTGAEDTATVSLSIGGTTYELLDKFGMPLTLSEIKKVFDSTGTFFAMRTPITCGIGSDAGVSHFIAFNLPVPSVYIVPLR